MNLPKPFINETYSGEDDQNYVITLAPKLANYHARLEYDEAGNANIVIVRNQDHKVILDMSLDDGEINAIDSDKLCV